MKNALLASVALLIGAPFACADDGAKLDPKANPAGVKVQLVAKTSTYRLTKALLDFKPASAQPGERASYPAVPKVDLVLRIVNDSDREMHIRPFGDDNVHLLLALQGDGAFSANVQNRFTRELCVISMATVAAHKTYELPVENLHYGFRNLASAVFWTKPGTYKLAAGFHTEVGWKDDNDDAIRLKYVTLASDPIEIKVEAEKP